MSTAHKFKNLDDLTVVFPEVPWRQRGDGKTFVFDEKQDKYVEVEKGQFVVSIGDRFEVADEEPEKAKPAEAPRAEKKTAAKDTPAKDEAPTVDGFMGAEPAPAE